jgi:hypothetical protein
VNRLLVDRLEVHANLFSAERDTQLVHDQRSAMWDGDAAADTRRSEVLPSLQHLEQHAFRLLIEPQQPDELAKNVVLGGAAQVELDRIFTKKLAQFHRRSGVVPRGK